jgi:hypothetical protein
VSSFISEKVQEISMLDGQGTYRPTAEFQKAFRHPIFELVVQHGHLFISGHTCTEKGDNLTYPVIPNGQLSSQISGPNREFSSWQK